MSVMTVTGIHFPESMIDYQRGGAAVAPLSPLSGKHFPAPESPPAFAQTWVHSYARQPRNSTSPGAPSSNHRHTHTASSSTLPFSAQKPAGLPSHSRSSSAQTPKRQPATPPSSYPTAAMQRAPTTASVQSYAPPRRSTSSRSSATTTTYDPSSYVALLRKQKATVWCDRSQTLDPRMAAAQRAAKQRANNEVHRRGNSNLATSTSGRASTMSSGGVVGKIRHGGVSKSGSSLLTGNLSGAGLPLRLSANEMIGDEEEQSAEQRSSSMVNRTMSSGHSSQGSMSYRTGSGYGPRNATISSTSPSAMTHEQDQGRLSTTAPPGDDESKPSNRSNDYFDARKRRPSSLELETEDTFGDLKEMKGPSATAQAALLAKKAEDLRRRGSVDERAISMSTGVRLFVANPDPDD